MGLPRVSGDNGSFKGAEKEQGDTVTKARGREAGRARYCCVNMFSQLVINMFS